MLEQQKQWQMIVVRYLPWVLVCAMAILLAGMFIFGKQWWHASQQQTMIDSQSLSEAIATENPLMALHQAYQLSQLALNIDNTKKLMQAITVAEASPDTTVRAYASYINANLYYDLSKIEQDIAAGGAHQQAVAQIELAREAYKRTIRLLPDFYDARFNLELLDRLSPEKRTQGWSGGVDGVTLQPFKRNGTALMRDNQRRGLP